MHHRRSIPALALGSVGACAALSVALLAAGCSPAPSPLPMEPSPGPTVVAVATPARMSPAPTPTATPTPSPGPLGEIADLTGLPVDPALAHRLPIVVLIDDNRVTRPQSGFNAAAVVWHAPADGGETRYAFVYQEGDSDEVGPVRSGRIYFAHWAAELRAAVAHYGGDLVSRTWFLKHDGRSITDIDALRTTAKPFRRVSTARPPHNAYTDTGKLRAAAIQLGGAATMDGSLHRRPFMDATPIDARPASQEITVPYRTGTVRYDYDRSANYYLRSVDGVAQTDPADGVRVTATNVVVLFMSFRSDTTIEPGHARPVLGYIGEGRALVFREGRLVEGRWQKADEIAPTRLVDAGGAEIPLVQGKTFFQVVPSGTKVSWAP